MPSMNPSLHCSLPTLARRVLVLILLLGLSFQATAQQYRILVTNDDGIDSPLLAVLKEELQALPGVTVVVSAPRENQSGASNSTIGSPLVVERIFRDGTLFGYGVHGRPADAVTFGLAQLAEEGPFDLVVSGINAGANVGDVAHGSGTVGAALRAMLLGTPALAVSQETSGVDTRATARFAAGIVQRFRQDGAPQGVLLSVNVPGGTLKGVRVRPMGESYLARSPYRIVEENGNTVTYESAYVRQAAEDPATDTFAYQDGYITVTPLRFDWTANELLPALESWNLQLP